MRVALFNYGSSGLFHYAASLANALIDQPEITEVRVYTSRYNNLSLLKASPKLSFVAIDLPHSIKGLLNYSLNVSTFRQWQDSLKKFQPDIIHITDLLPLYLWQYFLLKKYPIIFTQHDPVIHTGDPHQITLRLLQQYLQHISRKIIVHGETLRQSLLQTFSIKPEKVVTMPLGEFSILLKNPFQTVDRPPNTILFFGRITWYKGLDVLLKSLQELQTKGLVVKLLLVGPGQLEPYQPALAQLQDITVVNHYVPEAEVSDYFNQATLIILPYREATQSSVVSLALPAGLPIIATKVGALPEVLRTEYNSLLIPPNDSTALAQAIQDLLANSQLQATLRQNGYATAKTTLAWSTIATRHVRMYESII